ncbi:MAG: phosphodiester glycosidase family protein, partial [Actinomycetota bacterium]|nr:phosphodiester glycosidase family protein [Actinomycetota bacterium]
MKLKGSLLGALTLMLLALWAVLPAAGQQDQTGQFCAAELPLGSPGLHETRTTEQVAPGVTYTKIVRGEPSKKDFYTVDVAFKADRAAAEQVAVQLEADGYDARIETISQRAPDDPQTGPLGYLVRTGSFTTQAEADALRAELTGKGYTGLRTVYTGEDGNATSGPWVVHVLEIDPDLYKGTIIPELATEIVPGRETLTSISDRTDSLAAINGGYFVIGENDGTPGDLAGISVIDGTLVSEAVDGRTSLILPPGSGEGADIAAISGTITATSSDGATREVDGLNRKPGLIRGCGGDGGDSPTEQSKHDFTCMDSSELILFTPDFGTNSEPGPGVEAVLDSSGRVVKLRKSRGGPIPDNGSVLSGTGGAADWLLAHAKPGRTINISTSITADGAPLAPGTSVVNGGPRLLSNGSPDITAYAEGFVWPESPEFYYRFGVRRNPRTLAGTTPEGNLLLVAVDGRQPGYSVGASFEESALIMQALCAEEAVNLDGGGSTTLTIGEELMNSPSDPGNIERPIGDAIVLLP